MKRELDRRREKTMRKKTVNIKDIDPSYGIKDSKVDALERIESNLKEINKSLKEIIALLTAIKKKRTISV